MAEGLELATAYVRIIPTTEDIKSNLTSAMSKDGIQAGKESGEQSGKSFLGSFSTTTGKIGKTLGGIGDTLSKNVTAPIAAGGAAIMASWGQVDSGLDIIVQKTGASGDALKAMQDSATNLATSMPVSFEDAGTAIGEINTRFGVTGSQLESLSGDFLRFAQLNGTDVNNSIDIVQKSLSAFGLTADDAGAMLDTMNKVGQDTGISMDVLAQDMVTNSTALQGMGLNAASSATLLGNLEKSGVDVQAAMQGMTKVQAYAAKNGISMQEALTKAVSSSGDAIEVFGARSGAKLYDAFQNGTLSVDMFTDSTTNLTDNLGSVSDTFEATLDPADQWQTVLNNLMTIGYEVGNAVMPMIQQAVDTVVPIIQELSDKWNSLSPEMQDTIIKAALVAAAVGPMVTGFSKAFGVVSNVTNGLNLLKTGPLAGILGPIAAVVAIIAVLVAAFMNLWNTNEGFRDAITGIWEGIKETFSGLVDGITERLNALGINWETVTSTIKAIWDGFCQVLAPVFEGVFQQISNVFKFITNTILSVLDIFIGIFTGDWSGALNGVKNLFKGAWDFVTNTFRNVANTLSSVLNTILGFFGTDLGSIKSTVTDTFNNIKQSISDKITAAKQAVSDAIGAIKGFFSNLSLKFPKLDTGFIQTAKQTISDAVNKIKGLFNFSWSLPHINVPHFSVSGGKAPWGFGGKGSLPSVSVSWYAKAMDQPILLDSATIFGASENTLLGGGERGDEIIYGRNSLMRDIRASVERPSVNYVQNNYSPKALNRLEIYRQTRALIGA